MSALKSISPQLPQFDAVHLHQTDFMQQKLLILAVSLSTMTQGHHANSIAQQTCLSLLWEEKQADQQPEVQMSTLPGRQFP